MPPFGMGLSLSRAAVLGGLDPDAAAYIASLVSAGASVSSVQRAAIDSFIVGEKSSGRWDSIKRLYLPIWGVAAANAICMRSLTSGTFTVSGVTHAPGYVKATNSVSGFSFGTDLTSLGIGIGNAHVFGLIYIEGDNSFIACEYLNGGGGTTFARISSSSVDNFRLRLFSTNFFMTGVSRTGVLSLSETSSTTRNFLRRTAAGTSTATGGGTSSGTLSGNVYAMYDGSANGSDSAFGVYGCGTKMTSPDQLSFSAAIKTLWETCTGLSLP